MIANLFIAHVIARDRLDSTITMSYIVSW